MVRKAKAMSTKAKPTRKLRVRGQPIAAVSSDFWKPQSLEELAAAQGLGPIEHPEELFGQGADLWADDADFEAFLAGLRQSRRTGE